MTTLPSGSIGGYQVGGAGASHTVSGSVEDEKGKEYLSHGKLKRMYLDYLGTKREEIDEQQDARRFVHGSQWTAEQLQQLALRKQPASWENITKRKINGIVGTLARLKQDPKAYPRTPKHEQGAELATAVLRYVLDNAEWDAKDPICAEMAAIDGIGGVVLELEKGDRGDTELGLGVVLTDSFFYDPRSYKHDFSDCRYMGEGKWVDIEQAVEMFPEHEDQLRQSLENGTELTSEPDREFRWWHTDGEIDRVRIVDHWYRHKGKWCWAIYTGSFILDEGDSYLTDEDGNSDCKYIMFSAYIDQDGDRYGFVRDLKPLNQEINMRKSKALYTMLSRRIIAPRGSFDDIEKARRESARADGIVEYNMQGDAKPEFDDAAKVAETEAQFKFYDLARTAIESFGPNIAVTGEGLEQSSGRAIHLLQQAGLSDLGPYLQSYRGWKIRLYRAVWNAVQRHWTGERWVRVTDDDDISEFIQVNGVDVDPATGMPTLVNAIGSLDVDIILDEGPDTVNMMGDAYDTLSILAQKGAQIPPQVLLELAPLPVSVKKRLNDIMNPEQPSPEQQMEMANAEAEIAETQASAKLKEAQSMKALSEAMNPDQGRAAPEQPAVDPKMALETQKHTDQMEFQYWKTNQELEQKRLDRQAKWDETYAKAEMGNGEDGKPEAPRSTPLSGALEKIGDALKLLAAPKETTLIRDKSGRAQSAVTTARPIE